jgi:hypothetical protein
MIRPVVAFANTVGVTTLVGSAILLVRDARPELFAARAHDYLAALALGMIAVAWLVFQSARRVDPREWIKAILLAVAFLFWAANQFWPNHTKAMLFNDIAVALFVLDVFLSMIGWPPVRSGESDRVSRSDL